MKSKARQMIAILLCTSSLLTFAAAFTDDDAIADLKAAETVTTLGIMEERGDGAFDPAGTITRAEAAKLLYLAAYGGKDYRTSGAKGISVVDGQLVVNDGTGSSYSPTRSEPTYSDTKGHPLEGYIESCSTLGVVAGRGDGTFDPEGMVKVSELAKMLLVALGYAPDHEGLVGMDWRANTDALALATGLYDGLDQDTAEPVTRENAAGMILRALAIPMVHYDYRLTSVSGELVAKPIVTAWDPVRTLGDNFGRN